MNTTQPATNPWAFRPRDAFHALKKLLADPEQTEHVFAIIRALSGKTLLRGYHRFSGTAVGKRILAEKSNLIEVLSNRPWLRTLPANSLGARYLNFVESQDLTADGLVEASMVDEPEHPGENPAIRHYGERLRDMHDLWHVTTGYGRDVKGEVCLLAFTVAQTMNPGLALIVMAGTLKIARESGDWRIARAAWNGFVNGRHAAWLPAADWEQLLTQPIETVRQTLRVRPPKIYPDITDLKVVAA
jgi:ubiquinone biosynthesis protein COQ4